MFLLGILVLFGAAALGIDGSRAYEERRAAQTAADHAATAAAYASCSGSNLAASQTAGRLAATRNGYDDASASIVVDIARIGATGSDTYRAAITSIIPGTFARAIGMNTFTVSVEATAGGTGCDALSGGTAGAIFSGGNDCSGGKYGVDVSGSSTEVYGGVHSNSDASVGGSSNDFDEPSLDDPWTYVGSIIQGGTNQYQTGYPQDVGPSVRPWPAGYEPSVVSPAGSNDAYWNAWSTKAVADGHGGALLTSKISSITTNGVYYTSHSDGMDIGSIGAGVTNFTLIARNGPIKVSASNGNFSPDADGNGILALSGKAYVGIERCDKYTVALSGSNSDWNGIVWAPGGQIEFSGSSNSAVTGSLIGWAVRLNGSDLVIRYDSTLFVIPPDPTILILQ